MRTIIAILSCLLILAACSGDDGAAKKQKIEGLKKQYRALNAEKVALMETNTTIKTDSFKANAAYLSAKRKGDESAVAAAKLAKDEAEARAQQAIDAETALDERIRDLKDKIRRLGGKL